MPGQYLVDYEDVRRGRYDHVGRLHRLEPSLGLSELEVRIKKAEVFHPGTRRYPGPSGV